MLGILDSYTHKNETGLRYLSTNTKSNSKQSKDLNIRPETIKLLEENIGGKLHWPHTHIQEYYSVTKKKKNLPTYDNELELPLSAVKCIYFINFLWEL